MSTAFHPQTDGTTERYNQEIELYLLIYCISNPSDWPSAIPILEFTHNSRQHADRKQSPFELLYGYTPPAIPLAFEAHTPTMQERFQYMERWRQDALTAHEFARQRMAQRIKSSYERFAKGQLVWLEARNLDLRYNKKISTKREGPFEITEVLSPVTFRLKLPQHWKMHNVFHAALLTPYVETDAHGPAYPEPPADIVDGNPEYEIDRILRHKKGKNGTTLYQVLWKGYGLGDATWEPEESFTHASDVLRDYDTRLRKRNVTTDVISNVPEQTKQNTQARNRRARTRTKAI